MSADELTDQELLDLPHNDHRGAFRSYLNQSRHASDKQAFLSSWIKPATGDMILECGSSSGKTSIDFTRYTGCRCLGVDFDPEAIQVSTANRDDHFPELADRCHFQCGDISTMTLDKEINKVVMPDFSEHIPDRVFTEILKNIKTQLPDATLYIYTPNRSHIFEIMKHRNFILKNPGGHINVKTRAQLAQFLTYNGWEIKSNSWRRSSIPYVKYLESAFGYLPLLGKLFQRRIVVTATPN